jgi:hypothetical protein
MVLRGDVKREHARRKRREQTEHDQDIQHRLWPIQDPARRRRAIADFRTFCETYLAARFFAPWSADHLDVIAIMEECARKGGVFPIAMPRGSGKTALCLALCIWAILSGLRKFVLLIGATKPAANELVQSIKAELSENQLLAADFPREIGPFTLLEDEARRAKGQRWGKARTHVAWLANEVVFASIPGSKAAGAVIRITTITGRIRGAIHTTPDGRQIGPDLVVADDPQTDASARSPTQTDVRERAILSTTKGLARVGVRIGIMIPCTVIRRGDLADRLMDRKRHPDLRSKRTKMLYALPERLDMWDTYAQILGDHKAIGGDGSAATEYYRSNQQEMDRGAIVAWEHNFDSEEISAIQHAMNWYLFNRAGFLAECQQEPESESVDSGQITIEQVTAKLNGRPRLQVPLRCEIVTAQIDVHETLLYYHVSAWERNFTGYRIDWGAWPEQPDRYFTMATARRSLSVAYPGRGKEGAIYAGLTDLINVLFSRAYIRDDGVPVSLDICGVDSGFDQDVVAAVIRAQNRGKLLWPTKGVGLTAASRPFTEYKPEPGTTIGHHWRQAKAPKIQLMTINYDTNRWKSFFRDRLRVPMGDPGSFTLNGTSAQAEQLYAEHLASESPVKTSGPWGEVEIWRIPPARPDNHVLDAAVGCCVLASVLGCRLPEWGVKRVGRRRGKILLQES